MIYKKCKKCGYEYDEIVGVRTIPCCDNCREYALDEWDYMDRLKEGFGVEKSQNDYYDKREWSDIWGVSIFRFMFPEQEPFKT